MSAIEENKALVRRFFEAKNRGYLAAAVEAGRKLEAWMLAATRRSSHN